MRLAFVLFMRKFPKSSFRRPMEGRGIYREKTRKGLYLWPLSFGELDEEIEVHGRKIPARDRVPEVMVPDLSGCQLKPYVTYRAEDVFEPPMQSKDLFDTFYAPSVEAELQSVPLEELPDESSGKSIFSFFHSKKS